MNLRKHPSFISTCRIISTVLLFLLPFNPLWLYANPSGEQVVAGSASFHRNGSSLSIHQFSNRAIINWQDFSIALGELTEFLQPSRSSAVLNRVVGGNISEIYGTLKANGSVFLINPNGVLIGPSGIIEVGSFVASTRDVSNEEFLQGGPLNFTGNSTAELVNLGRISAQDDVYLMAEAVRNEGHITAGREVGLAAGGAFYLQEQGEERFKVKLPHNGSARDTGVLNTGQIEAARATLQATGSAYSVAVNNGGVIRATGVQRTPEGRVFLVGSGGGSVLNTGSISARNADGTGGTVKMAAGEGTLRHSGQVDVTGTTGGRAELTGERVAVTGRVDASGQQGGGRIYVGGSYQGREEPEIANAQRTLVGTTGELRADALESGDGGRIIVWADGDTAFHGTLSARGGLLGGNGGFAEISGKEALTLTGSTDLSAPQGQVGTLLLDPKNIWVVDAHASPVVLTDVDQFDDPDTNNYILNTTISGAGSNVTLQATNDIYFNAGVTMGAFNLTLQAGRSILIGDTTLPHVTIDFTTGNFTATINDENANSGIPPHSRDLGLARFRMQNATVQFASSGAGRSFTVNDGNLASGGGRIELLGGGLASQSTKILNAGAVVLNCMEDILMQGGSEMDTFVRILTEGASSPIQITSTDGKIELKSGDGIGSSVTLDTTGVNSPILLNALREVYLQADSSGIFVLTDLAESPIYITSSTRGIKLEGGSVASSSVYVTTGQGSSPIRIEAFGAAGIELIGGSGWDSRATVVAYRHNSPIDVVAHNGKVSLIGGTNVAAYASLITHMTNSPINVTAARGIDIISGNGFDSSAYAYTGGDISDIRLVTQDESIRVVAGWGSSSPAGILAMQPTSSINFQALNGNVEIRGGGNPASNSSFGWVQAGNDITIDAYRTVIAAGSGMGTSALDSNYVLVQAGNVVNINAGGGGVEVAGGAGSYSQAQVISGNAMTVNTQGSVVVHGGIGNQAHVQLLSGSDQTITAANNINIHGGLGGNSHARVIANTGDQTITTAGILTLYGHGTHGYVLISGFDAGITTLDFNIGTWLNNVFVERPTAGGTVVINNNLKLDIYEAPGLFGYVQSDVLEFRGVGIIGSKLFGAGMPDTRLNTDVNSIVLGNALKSLYLSEIGGGTTGDVAISGVASGLDLITDTPGNILQGSSSLTLQYATLRTARGNITLDDPNNAVANFYGVAAQDGFLTYYGQGTTNFYWTAFSPEVPLISDSTTGVGDVGVYAGRGIVLSNPTGIFNVFTDEILCESGDVRVTAEVLRFDAMSGSVGGIDGPSGDEGWVYTPQGTQTYNVSSNIQLLTNTHMRADSFPNDTITFNGSIISPGGVAGLQVGSSPVFNGANVGTVPNPLAYLLFSNNAPSTITFTPNFNTAVINFSLINQNDAQMLINAATPTFIVDHGTVGPGPGLFQGGNMTVAGPLQIFGAIPAQVTGNIGGLSPQLFTGQEFLAAWRGNPFTPLISLPSFSSSSPSFVAYKPLDPLGLGGGGGGSGSGLSLALQARDAWQDEDDNGGDRRRNPYRNQFKFLYQDRARATPAVLAGASSYQLYKEQLFERSELTHLIQQVERKKGEEVKLMNY